MAKKELMTVEDEPHVALALTEEAMAMMDTTAGQGFEDVASSDLALPQFKLLQSGSPQTKRSDAAYVQDAQEGMWLDIIRGELYTSLLFVPCKFATHYIEWDGGTRGLLIANHGTDRSVMQRAKRDEKFNLDRTAEGHVIVQTATWYGLVIGGQDAVTGELREQESRAVITFSSTGLKVSRRWISDAQSIQLKRADGSYFNPPLFAMSYKLDAQATKNDKGSWYLPVVNRAGFTLDLPRGKQIFEAAREFSRFATEMAGQLITVTAEDAPQFTSKSVDDNIPF